MPTVARMGLGGGVYIISYEDCGPANCDVYTKTSADGDNWGSGPSDMGTRAETSNGLHLEVSPVITWVENGGADGTLYLTAHREVTAGAPIPADQAVVFTNANSVSGPSGPWPTIHGDWRGTLGELLRRCSSAADKNRRRRTGSPSVTVSGLEGCRPASSQDGSRIAKTFLA
jgi:hypothetical protein